MKGRKNSIGELVIRGRRWLLGGSLFLWWLRWKRLNTWRKKQWQVTGGVSPRSRSRSKVKSRQERK